MQRRIPEAFRVPGTDREPHTLAIDFALVRGAGGEIEPRLIECQGFPSLYAMQVVQGDIWTETCAAPGPRPRFDHLLRGSIARGTSISCRA